ncbi:hypothetical protein AB1Y20_008765 [Prymnesium parvum]|uniref:Uncharacterized protein n=1 Tax=Prymnesium parvum TaxID=97485 RepID=A0AB34IS41_PRYPA
MSFNCAGTSSGPTRTSSSGQLRPHPAKVVGCATTPLTPAPQNVVIVVQKSTVSLEELQKLAATIGCVVMPMRRWRKRVGLMLARSLRTMEGRFIYQSVALKLPSIPREAAIEMFPSPPVETTPTSVKWVFDSALEVSHNFSSLLSLSGLQTMGASRAIQRASEPLPPPT